MYTRSRKTQLQVIPASTHQPDRPVKPLLHVLGMALLVASSQIGAQHPGPQPRPTMSQQQTSADGTVTFVTTTSSLFGQQGSELPYVPTNAFDGSGVEMPNTLPSRPDQPFNLHAGPVLITSIDKTSPRNDIKQVIDGVRKDATNGVVNVGLLQRAIDILEGNPVPGRSYSGFSMLHYTAGERVKRVIPVVNEQGVTVGGNVEVHQIWFDNQIESDTALVDPSAVQDVPWTVTYVIDVLDGGADDFSPFGMFFDRPQTPGSFGDAHFGIDQSFWPMSAGKRHVIKIKNPPAKYYKLTYTWGWRQHPPRIQAMENSLQSAGGLTLLEWEQSVFGVSPRGSEATRTAAIERIGDLSPAKRLWRAFREAKSASGPRVVQLMDDALMSYADWSDRTRLPRGVSADINSDATFLYVNNMIYGSVDRIAKWDEPGTLLNITLLNGDSFPHGYMAVDFGGVRGWENQYQDAGGPAASHTFGRAHWWPLAGPIMVPPAQSTASPGRHRVEMLLNFRPGDRLKLYQFDPLHHDVAIYSLH